MAIFLLLLLAAPQRAPEAAFAIDEAGFLTLKLTRDGKPVEGTAKVYEGPPGEGETVGGSTLVSQLKPGEACLLGITIAGKECDLIALERHGGEARPARVSLTFGTRPCCVAVPRTREADEPRAEDSGGGAAFLAAAGGACLLAALALAFLRGKTGGKA